MVTQLVNSRAEIQTQVCLTPNASPSLFHCTIAQSVDIPMGTGCGCAEGGGVDGGKKRSSGSSGEETLLA